MIVSLLDSCTVVFSYDRCREYCQGRPAGGRRPPPIGIVARRPPGYGSVQELPSPAPTHPGALGPVARGRTEWSVVPCRYLPPQPRPWWWRSLAAPHSRCCFPGHLRRQRMLVRRSGSARPRGSSAASLRFMQSPPFDAIKTLHRPASQQQPIRASTMHPSHRPASRLERQVLARDDVSSIN